MIGKQILSDAYAKNPNHNHPRILLTAEDFAQIKNNLNDPVIAASMAKMRESAEKLMTAECTKFAIPDGIRLLSASRTVLGRVRTLSQLYKIDGDEKYAERAYLELEEAASWDNWNPRHFLDTAELSAAFAIGYDWLYDYLSEEQKQLILDTVARKSFFAFKEELDDVPEHKNATLSLRGYRWLQDKPGDNWKMVCGGSFAAAALAFYDAADEAFCETVLTACFEDTYQAVRDFYNAEDGAYSEGVNYWIYATRFLAFFSSALTTAAGSDFGLTDYIGVARSPYWLLALASPDYLCFNFGDAHAVSVTSPIFGWLAARYNDPSLYAIRRADIERGKADYMDIIYFRDVPYTPPSNIPLAFGRVGGDNASFRADCTENSLYAAIHFAKNNVYHGHNDMGTFIVNVGNKRFFVDLGADNYNLAPGYGRCYRYRAEGHNTLIFNPAPDHDQKHVADCRIDRFSDGEESFALANMSDAYPEKEVVRGMKLDRREGSLLIQDEIRATAEDVIRWSAHTPASVRLFESGKAALLDIGGVKMYVESLADGVFEVRAGVADENSPVVWNPNANENTKPEHRGQALNNGMQKLVIHLKGKTSYRIAIRMLPLTDGREVPTEKPTIKPLAIW